MEQKPRILILSTAYLPFIGGSELAIRNITDRLPEFDFDLVTGRHTPSQPLVEQMGRIRVFRVGSRLSGLTLTHPKFFLPFTMAITALRLARTRQYSLMHAYQASQAAGAAWLVHLVRPSLPFLVTLQEGKLLDQQSWPVRWARALILWSANRITAISNYLAQYARLYNKTPIDIIPNGVDTEALVPRGEKPTSNKKVILSISRLVPKNGLENLIRAMPQVQERFSDAQLVLVGDGPLKEKLQVIANNLKVRVNFAGSVLHERLAQYLHQADVFARPSLSEGLGSAFLEAMAAGVPVVGSRVGGIADFLEHERTGLVCNPANPSDIASKIIRILTDNTLRDGIVSHALAMVRERYNWDVIAPRMGQIYREMSKI